MQASLRFFVRARWFVALLLATSSLFVPTTEAAKVENKLPPPVDRQIDFVKDIQPIFANNCYECHGPKKQEHDLRLDQKTTASRGGESGPAFVAGKSAESLLIHAVAGLKADLARMPKKRDPLTTEQIGLLRAWIDQGADWPENVADAKDPRQHWAFKPPIRPKVPAVKNKNWVRTPIDNYVLARLEKEGLKPSPEADKVILLRRLSLDLIGLPPTIAEVDAFLGDKSSDAWDKQVERLLNSPHYGERWGRHWLDAGRYADSDGFEKDKPRFIWAYRDWVINAFNQDMPYDRFVIGQIAGDQLPNPTQEDLVATGFLRNAMLNEEGGVDPEQFRMEAMFDRMDCIGKSILGLTIQCAQCHNHKYDPLKQEEYYRLFAFLNNDHEASLVTYTPQQEMKVADITREMRDLEAGLRHTTPDWQERMNRWEDSVKDDQPEWIVVRAVHVGDNGERYYDYDDGSIRASSYAPTKWTADFRGTNNLPLIGAFPIRFQTNLDGISLIFAVLLGVISGLIFGIAPAWHLARVDPQTAIRSGTRSAGRSAMRNTLMAAEVGLALLVLLAAGMFLRSFTETRDIDPGFRREGVLLAAYDMSDRAVAPPAAREFTRPFDVGHAVN